MLKTSAGTLAPLWAMGIAVGLSPASARAADCYRDTVNANSPLRYWRLSESSGTTAADTTGNGDATYRNGVTLGVPGTLVIAGNTAAKFSGSQFIDAGSSPIISNLATHTVEAWFMCDAVGDMDHLIYSEDTPGGTIFQVRVAKSGKLEYLIHGPSAWNTATGTTTITTGVWYYVAATLDETGMKLYLWNGGSLGVEGTNPNTLPAAFTAQSADVGSGRYSGGLPFGRFRGTIDEVAVYGSALSPAQLGQRVIDRLPHITTLLEDASVCPGGTRTLTVGATATDTLSYQWRLGGTDIPGATAPSIVLDQTQAGSYDCVVSTACGTATSNAAVVAYCPGDFNCSGSTPDGEDIVAFFDAWLAGDPSADVNGSGSTPDGEDIVAFFDAWLAGC